MIQYPVSILIPTRNRAHVLERTLPSYISQELVDEIVIVDDAGTDNTRKLIQRFQKKSPIHIRYIRYEQQKGSAGARNIAIQYSKTPYIAWGEDDVLFGKNYVPKLLEHLKRNCADIVGGRLIYLQDSEAPLESLKRVRFNVQSSPSCNLNIIEFNFDAFPDRPTEAPFLHACILTKTKWVKKFGYDQRYRGNGYREETDFQLNVLAQGGKILFCPDVSCFHLARSDVNTGGQHDRSWINYEYWTIRNNCYFLDKNYSILQNHTSILKSRLRLKLIFTLYRIKKFIYPQVKKSVLASIKSVIMKCY